MKKVYVHYGHKKFEPYLIHSPHTERLWNKPKNALWASPVNCEHGWKAWCEQEDFHVNRLDKCFYFTLKDDAKVLYIDSMKMVKKLPVQNINEGSITIFNNFYDFDQLKNDGYDAVEISISDCWDIYHGMYGWDCDSIAILNPDIVEVLSDI